jgi:transposase-like protein
MVVTDGDFQRLLAAIGTLSQAQLDVLRAAIEARLPPPATPEKTPPASGESKAEPDSGLGLVAEIEARFADAPVCPACQSREIGKWGSANGLKRYKCKPCKVTFNCLTGTPLAQLHKRELWGEHAKALIDGIALRKVAARLDIDLTTSFRWRHRFLEAPKDLKPKALDGTVEADETYFLRSEKGSPSLQRPPRKRGGKAKKRGLSDEQVPVLIARDSSKATTDQVLEDRSTASISAALEPVVQKSAVLVSDGAHAYRAFANKASILHVALNLSEGEHTWGVYHIQNVNNYCSRLKGWMRRFNGVATRYLDSYLGWHRFADRTGHTLDASLMLAAARG